MQLFSLVIIPIVDRQTCVQLAKKIDDETTAGDNSYGGIIKGEQFNFSGKPQGEN